jgi:hypothetical protein
MHTIDRPRAVALVGLILSISSGCATNTTAAPAVPASTVTADAGSAIGAASTARTTNPQRCRGAMIQPPINW